MSGHSARRPFNFPLLFTHLAVIVLLVGQLQAEETLSSTVQPLPQTDTTTALSVVRSSEQIQALVIQPDGAIVAAGVSDAAIQKSFVLARYQPNGRLDESFGQKGIVTTRIADTDVEVIALALQTDGKLLVTGQATHTGVPSSKLILARYHTNGSLDDTFGEHGLVSFLLPFQFSSPVRGSTLQSDNKLLVAISSWSEKGDFLLLRYQPDGKLDPSFGAEGMARGATGFMIAHLAFTLDPTGKALVAASPQWRASGGLLVVPGNTPPQDWCPGEFNDGRVILARYNEDGSIDADFTRRLTHKIGVNEFRWISAFAFQPDGKLLVGGDADCRLTFARYNVDGSLDPSFGKNGLAPTEQRSFGRPTLTLQPDGKLLAAFSSYGAPFLARYNADGSLDATFHVADLAMSVFQDIHALALQPDGKIITAGYVVTQDAEADFAVARYHTDGRVDSDFGEKGRVTTNFAVFTHTDDCTTPIPPFPEMRGVYHAETPLALRDEAATLLLQPDGKILVAGTAGKALAVSRYQSNGGLDRNFGVDGVTTVRLSTLPAAADVVSSLVLQADGKILVLGTTADELRNRLFLVRLTPEGKFDNSFGKEGKLLPSVGGVASSVTVLPDGKLLTVAGGTGGSPRNFFFFSRFFPDGSLDPAFGVGGTMTVDLVSLTKIAQQSDGAIIFTGMKIAHQTKSRIEYAFVLQRYAADGTRDESFGEHGEIIITDSKQFSPSTFALSPDGKIIGGGVIPYYTVGREGAHSTVSRYYPDGSADPHFGDGGKVRLAIGSRSTVANASAVQQDGKLLLAGTCANARNANTFLARYNTDGSTDQKFAANGIIKKGN